MSSDNIKLTAELIYGLTNSLLISKFDSPVATPQFHLELWELMCSDDVQVAVAAPRSHAKSTAVTMCYTIANAVFRTAEHIMIVSDTEGQAINFLGNIKNEFLENEELIDLFGVDRLVKDKETEFIIQFSDGHLCRIFAKGSEQKLRGTIWRNKRPDLIIGDDLENDEMVMSDERREKFRKWFYNALLPCGSPNRCKVRIVGTILHLDSLLERLMPPLGNPNTVVDGLKQYSSSMEGRSWRSVRYKAHNEDYSELLWPENFTPAFFKRKYNDYLQQGFPEGYSQEYLNYPIDEATAYFRKRDFVTMDKESDRPEDFYIAADLAISEKDKNAFTVFVVCSLDHMNILKVRDVLRFRGDSLQIIDEVFNLYSRYRPELMFVEQENIARTLGPILKKEMEERNVFPNIVPMTASQDKVKRARALQARMRAGMVHFDKDAEWYQVLQQELLQFPRGAYMDQVDALAWVALGLDKMYDAPTRQDVIEKEYLDEYESTGNDHNSGISFITGY